MDDPQRKGSGARSLVDAAPCSKLFLNAAVVWLKSCRPRARTKANASRVGGLRAPRRTWYRSGSFLHFHPHFLNRSFTFILTLTFILPVGLTLTLTLTFILTPGLLRDSGAG